MVIGLVGRYHRDMTLAYYTHPDMLDHHPGVGHAERSERLTAVIDALDDHAGLDLNRLEAPQASVQDLRLVHPQHYIDAMLAAAPRDGIVRLDEDTFLSSGSIIAAVAVLLTHIESAAVAPNIR